MIARCGRSKCVESVIRTACIRRGSISTLSAFTKNFRDEKKRVTISLYLNSPSQHRSLSTITDAPLEESEFHDIADETLEELIDSLTILEESLEDLDVELSVREWSGLWLELVVNNLVLSRMEWNGMDWNVEQMLSAHIMY